MYSGRSINAGEVLRSGLDVRATTAPINRRTFPDSRYLGEGRCRGIVGGEKVRASSALLFDGQRRIVEPSSKWLLFVKAALLVLSVAPLQLQTRLEPGKLRFKFR
jgi:hypothetical protein